MKFGYFSRLAIPTALSTIVSSVAIAASLIAPGSSNARFHDGFVRTNTALFAWGTAPKQLAEGFNPIMTGKSIDCPSSKGCVISALVMAQITSTAGSDIPWAIETSIDGKDALPGEPVQGLASTAIASVGTFSGSLQITKGKHTITTFIYAAGTATLNEWHGTWEVYQ